ncbi:MAG: hypothetical protein KGI40_06285 [Xanthomonadaceae bacterium]|nr:hypothetical protein [Xanthomonadaceae bacterium]MDE2177439.1 hypothetical protein [Xanthomonadaceae bacterium]MDE2246029.1 hypothetical protein [Xanthomonadaceae bacterium]
MTAARHIEVTRCGRENQPVVVIENFVPDPQALIDDACRRPFGAHGAYYPGIRAPVPPALVQRFLEGLDAIIAEVFGITSGHVLETWYSLVTTPPAALAPIQRLPHYDGLEPGRLALLHFLGREAKGGTAFYRQRSSGYESVDAGRFPAYRAQLEVEVARSGLPQAGYIAGDTPLFERIALHGARFNRAILYRGNTLHCADIPGDLGLSTDPARGRLTVNTFLMEDAA